MHESMLRTLQNKRPTLRERWEALLRLEPVTSPLANPDALVYLMDWTLDRFFETLRKPSGRRRIKDRGPSSDFAVNREACPCGRNPLIAYFSTAEQTLVELALPILEPAQREAGIAAIRLAMQVVAKREIETFCAVCQYRLQAGVTTACNGRTAGSVG